MRGQRVRTAEVKLASQNGWAERVFPLMLKKLTESELLLYQMLKVEEEL